jgi:hypothetical protein
VRKKRLYKVFIGHFIRNISRDAILKEGRIRGRKYKLLYLTDRTGFIKKETLLFMSLNKLNEI